MPFDYEEYQKKCNTLTTEQLHREWENYTRQISGGATSTATSVLFSPLTAGISLVGLGLSAPRIHNARKKREIIEAGLQARGTTHNTRKRDVIAPMAVAGTLGGLTLGLAGPGADMIAGAAVGHGMEYAVSHAALDATGAVIEHSHDEHSKKKADEKLHLQYQNFQQQYVQEQANLQSPETQLNQQAGLQVIPPPPQHSRPETPQAVQIHQTQLNLQPGLQPVPYALQNSRPGTPQPGQITQTQLSDVNLGLQISPAIPQHSRPGTPQPFQTPQYQPLSQGQEQKYEYVPVSAAHNVSISYQPASHQQQFAQPVPVIQPQPNSTVPECQPIQQPEKYLVTVPAQAGSATGHLYPSEKTATYVSAVPQTKPSAPSPCPSPLPQYSSADSVSMCQSQPQELPSPSPISIEIHPNAHPNMHIDLPPAPPTMEEEILFLKARLLQLEIEKREANAAQQAPQVGNGEIKESQPALALTPPSIVQTQDQHYYPPPPASPALPPQSPNIPHTQPQYPPPPPPPRQHSQSALPPPPPPPPTQYTYQPSNFPPPPSSPNSQQQPQYQRHDSGYYSNASTPTASNRLSQSYPISPQATVSSQHRHNPSISMYQPSPMSPAPPPYAPGTTPLTGSGKDYFGQGIPPSSPSSGGNQNCQTQSSHGSQGWQWGAPAAPVSVLAPPMFAPPPPSTWRG